MIAAATWRRTLAAIEGAVHCVSAEGETCGTDINRCYVANRPGAPLDIQGEVRAIIP